MSCPSFNVLNVLSRLPCLSPTTVLQSQMHYLCCHILAVLFSLSCPGRPVQALLSPFPVFAVTFLPSSSIYPVPAVLYQIPCPHGLKNFKVLDTFCITTCISTANNSTWLSELHQVTARDGIHFVKAGYAKLAERCTPCLKTLMAPVAKPTKTSPHFWLGFKSTCSSAETSNGGRGNSGVGGNTGYRCGPARGRLRARTCHPYWSNNILLPFHFCLCTVFIFATISIFTDVRFRDQLPYLHKLV
jgi:hypothetical protein